MAEPARPFVIDLDAAPPSPATAPAVPEPVPSVAPVASGMSPPRSRALPILMSALGGLVSLAIGLWLYDFVTGLIARFPALGWLALALAGVVVGAALVVAIREWSAWRRLGQVETLRTRVPGAMRELAEARSVLADLNRLYAGRPEMAWAQSRLAEQAEGVMDADALIHLAESTLLAAPDQAARREVEAAARRVAAATALVPLALVDVAVALAANLRMIRRIAEIYGGRAGSLGSWRLLRRVMGHLVATGAVAVGDDLISSVAGGGMMSKLSRRFGEGVVNGALTARVGIAAMEVCRPLPFAALPAPRVTSLLGRALTGLFGSSDVR